MTVALIFFMRDDDYARFLPPHPPLALSIQRAPSAQPPFRAPSTAGRAHFRVLESRTHDAGRSVWAWGFSYNPGFIWMTGQALLPLRLTGRCRSFFAGPFKAAGSGADSVLDRRGRALSFPAGSHPPWTGDNMSTSPQAKLGEPRVYVHPCFSSPAH